MAKLHSALFMGDIHEDQDFFFETWDTYLLRRSGSQVASPGNSTKITMKTHMTQNIGKDAFEIKPMSRPVMPFTFRVVCISCVIKSSFSVRTCGDYLHARC